MRRLGVGLDDRREIGAGIGEQVFDAALGQERQIRLRDAVDRQFLARHASRPFVIAGSAATKQSRAAGPGGPRLLRFARNDNANR